MGVLFPVIVAGGVIGLSAESSWDYGGVSGGQPGLRLLQHSGTDHTRQDTPLIGWGR
jgi:hypothetical protein